MGAIGWYRFGVFEFDADTPQLRKAGRRVKLRPQGLKLLGLFVSRPREVISRDEIAQSLWDADVFVDVEQGVNHTIKQVRAALGDDAESPRYVETIPRRGYRFIAPVEVVVEPNDVPVPVGSVDLPLAHELTGSTPPAEAAPWSMAGWMRHRRARTTLIACALLASLGAAVWVAHTLSERVGVATPATSRPATRRAEAYEAYLRGLWHLKGRSSATPIVSARADMWHAAVQELERALMLDPEFALARAALASAYTQLYFYDTTDRGFDQKAFVEIERALRIDPRLPEAYLARAQLTWTARNRFPHEAAITDLRRAVVLNPNLADAHLELEKIYYHIGLTDRAVAAGEQAQRLDPYQAWSTGRGFRALIDAGRLEQARLVLDGNPNLAPYARGDALIALGRIHDALRYLSRSEATRPDDADYDVGALALLGLVHARLNQPEEAERVMAMVIPAAENSTALSHMHHAQLHIGATLGLLGRKADAVRWLTKAADEGYPSYPRFSTDPSLTPLKGYPAYEALLQRLRIDWERWKRSL